ncbi:MAG: Asp23/Gls24 family envelope stress response protein [Anaerolineales bacterium]|nr:Asp23/Gls24 family envelope stress response protein [Anaerolineales bacterium]
MAESRSTAGKTTIALDVLLTIAKLTTLNVQGVNRLSTTHGDDVKSIFKRGHHDTGILIDVKNDTVYADLYVVLNHDVNIRDVCRSIQQEVSRAISEMVGMQVGRVNVHVKDIDYPMETEE